MAHDPHEPLITRYVNGARLPAESIKGLTKAQMLAYPVPGTWSVQEVILHLMDSDLIASDRMKRVIAEHNPLLMNYDESRFAQRLHYDQLNAAAACELFEKNRIMTAAMLRTLTPETFQRTGIHSQTGVRTLESLVTGYADHLDHHLTFIEAKRRALGK